jgi:hypothetical protein
MVEIYDSIIIIAFFIISHSTAEKSLGCRGFIDNVIPERKTVFPNTALNQVFYLSSLSLQESLPYRGAGLLAG